MKNRIQSTKTHSGSQIHHRHDNSSPKCQGFWCVNATFMPKQQEPISAQTVAAGHLQQLYPSRMRTELSFQERKELQ